MSPAVDENCSGVLRFCLFVQNREDELDPITDIFRTMHVTAFGLHRLEATAPWGVIQEKQTEEKVTPADKKMSPTDLAHFAMLSRGTLFTVQKASLFNVFVDFTNRIVWCRCPCVRAWDSRPSRRPAPVLACRCTPGSSSRCRFER